MQNARSNEIVFDEGASGALLIRTAKAAHRQHQSHTLIRDGQIGGLTLIVAVNPVRTTLARRTDGIGHARMGEDFD